MIFRGPTLANDGQSVTSKYMWPFNEDLMRFDFEIEGALPPPIFSSLAGGMDSASESTPSNIPSSREDSPVS